MPPSSGSHYYQHTALPNSGIPYIRLISIHPTEKEENEKEKERQKEKSAINSPSSSPLSCSIFQTPLIDAPPYTCLSYSWGDPDFSYPISLDGQPFLITPSLGAALSTLRRCRRGPAAAAATTTSTVQKQQQQQQKGDDEEEEVLFMWIDAICIDQADVKERSAQVGLMRQIYQKSSRVVVWIGEEAGQSDRAMAFLAEMGKANSNGDQKSEEEYSSLRHSPPLHHQSMLTKRFHANVLPILPSTFKKVLSKIKRKSLSSRSGVGVKALPSLLESKRISKDKVTFSAASGSNSNNGDGDGDNDNKSNNNATSRASSEQDKPSDKANDLSPIEQQQQQQHSLILPPREDWWQDWWVEYLRQFSLQGERAGHIMFGFPILYDLSPWAWNFIRNPCYLADWEAVDALLARPWWSRTWVVQEVWNSTNTVLQCGNATLDWSIFERAMDFHEAWDDMGSLIKDTPREQQWAAAGPESLKRRYSLAIHISKKRLMGSKLSDLLWNTWDRETTDPRDKVFAILSLVGQSDHGHGFIMPDYSKTLNQVFRETARYIITSEQSLDVLLAANGLARRDGLPSWVPDWRKEANDAKPTLFVNRNLFHLLYFGGSMDSVVVHGHGYRASGDVKPVYKFDDDDEEEEEKEKKGGELSTLQVAAILFDSIKAVDRLHQDGTTADDIIRSSVSAVKRTTESGISDTDLQSSHGIPDEEEIKTVLCAGWTKRFSADVGEQEVLKSVMRRRRFFTTTNGYMGVGPETAAVGDVVCIIAGCNFPMVIRGDPRGKSHTHLYGVVGEAYVHGIMGGEAVDSSSWQNITLT